MRGVRRHPKRERELATRSFWQKQRKAIFLREMEPPHSIALGDTELDREHALFELHIRMLAGAPQQEAVHVLKDLRAHAADHFEKEDAEIRRLKPSNGQCHLDEHAAVLKSLDEVIARLSSPATDADLAERLRVSLASELMRWLPEHVNEMDYAIAKSRAHEAYGGCVIKISRAPKFQNN